MIRYLFCLSLLSIVLACNDTTKEEARSANDFTIDNVANPELGYENLQLFPIRASQSFISTNADIGRLQVIDEALAQSKFRITEKKPFGRFGDRGAVNNLTVQNKTGTPVFLMAGDIVQGGKQDRVLAEDQVIAGRMITDIPVFCVEQGRWSFDEHQVDENLSPQQIEQDKKIVAFRGYYHIAPRAVREQAVVKRDQQGVWEKVGEITAAHNAQTGTQAYAGLEGSDDFTSQREAYLQFYADKFTGEEGVIGLVAVSGSRVIGADLFGHPELFAKKYQALLHAYITDALTDGSRPVLKAENIDTFSQSFFEAYKSGQISRWKDQVVHFAKL